MVGTSQLAAPITSDGVVLSQPHSSTTASIGWRGWILPRPCSPGAEHGRRGPDVGFHPARSPETRAETRPPPTRRSSPAGPARENGALHGVSSDHVLQMPITGRPSNTSPGNPWFRIQLRWMNPSLSLPPNHACDRNFRFFHCLPLHCPASVSKRVAPTIQPGVAEIGKTAAGSGRKT